MAPLALILGIADAKITNFDVNLSGTSEFTMTWDALAQTEIDKGYEGYAVQWSDSLQNMDKDGSMRQWKDLSTTSVNIARIGIDPGITHYFRVYTYFTNGDGQKIYTHGSDVVNLSWMSDNTSTKSVTERTELVIDPSVIVNTTTDSGITEDYEFPRVNIKKYDTFAIVSYTRPFDVPKVYLDGYVIDLATDAAFNDIVVTGEANGPNLTSMRFNGLEPSTKYYVRARFFQSDDGVSKPFGTMTPEHFTTLAKMNDGQIRRLELLRRQKKLNLTADVTVWMDGKGLDDVSVTSNAATDADAYTIYEVNDDLLNSSNEAAIEAEIAQLQKQIQVLRRRLVTIRSNNRANNNNFTRQKRKTSARQTATRSELSTYSNSSENDDNGLTERRTTEFRWAPYSYN